MASAVDHYREGESLLDALFIPRDAALDKRLSLEERREASAMLHAMATFALAHFTAAVAANLAILGPVAASGYDDADLDAWREAAGTKPASGQCACDHHGDHAGCAADCECAR